MDAAAIKPGFVVAQKYRLDKQLGAGAMGMVWRGHDTRVERDVAIKFMHADMDPKLNERFFAEAKAMGRLNHPNCITLFDFGLEADLGVYYLVMEMLEGKPLSDWRVRHVPVLDVLQVGKQLATALAYAHHQGIAHRDLKPENIFLAKTFDGDTVVKVLDFGLARISTGDVGRLTQAGEVFGTPAYMSPDQIRDARSAGPPSDLYSVGVILYELLEGKLPFDAETTFDLITAHVTQPPPPLTRPDVPSELVDVVDALLKKTPDERISSALELHDRLADIEALDDDFPTDDTTQFLTIEPPRETLERSSPPGGRAEAASKASGAPSAAAILSNAPTARQPGPDLLSQAPTARVGAETTLDIPAPKIAGPGRGARTLLLVVGPGIVICTLAIIAVALLGTGDAAHESTLDDAPPNPTASEPPRQPPVADKQAPTGSDRNGTNEVAAAPATAADAGQSAAERQDPEAVDEPPPKQDQLPTPRKISGTAKPEETDGKKTQFKPLPHDAQPRPGKLPKPIVAQPDPPPPSFGAPLTAKDR